MERRGEDGKVEEGKRRRREGKAEDRGKVGREGRDRMLPGVRYLSFS